MTVFAYPAKTPVPPKPAKPKVPEYLKSVWFRGNILGIGAYRSYLPLRKFHLSRYLFIMEKTLQDLEMFPFSAKLFTKRTLGILERFPFYLKLFYIGPIRPYYMFAVGMIQYRPRARIVLMIVTQHSVMDGLLSTPKI